MDSIEKVYMEHAKKVYYFLLSKTNNSDVAEELTQETFYQAIKSIDKYEGKSSIYTWLCGIAHNVWLSYIRKNKYNVNIDDVENELIEQSTEESVILDWDKKEIVKYLHQLKEPTKEVMYLRLMGNLSFRDIGDIMGKTENWARVTFYRGKEDIIREVKKNE